MDMQVISPGISQRVLLYFGLLAPLVYLVTDRVAGRLLKGYSFAAQSMSELTASGSPTRALVVILDIIAAGLLIAFAVGVWQVAGRAILPRIVAGLVIGNAVLSLFATFFFPNTYGVRPVFASPGVLIMAVSVLCSMLAYVFGAAAYGGWFRVLSIALPAAFILLTAARYATAATPAAVAAGSMVGSQERTMAYAFFIWVMALAVYLLALVGKGVSTPGA